MEAYRSKQTIVPPAAPSNVLSNLVNPAETSLQRPPEASSGVTVPGPPHRQPSKPATPIKEKENNDPKKKIEVQPQKAGNNVRDMPQPPINNLPVAAPPSHSAPKAPLPSKDPLKPKPNAPLKVIPAKRPTGKLSDSLARAPKKRLLVPLADIGTHSATTKARGPDEERGSTSALQTHDSAATRVFPKPLAQVGSVSKRRFVTLKPNPPAIKPASVSVPVARPPPPGIFELYSVRKEYTVAISNITIPPPLSQRKRIKGLALILRDINDAERRACCLASRTLRYAAYVSAQFLLYEEFPGQRTDLVLARAQDCFTNLWPYLKFRRQEKQRLKQLYQTSFLSRYVPRPMSERIWGNPDEGDEVALALRFILSKLWFTVSLFGDSGRRFLEESVLSLERLAGNEIWKVSVLTVKHVVQTIFVLGDTGEAIGYQDQDQDSSRLVRSDWKLYLDSASGLTRQNVLNSLRCANEEEFKNGISRSWVQRTKGEGELGALKRKVASRYVMASVVANSVSGPQMSHLQMAMQTASIPLEGTRPNHTINLFLSEHHHVESVHFTSTSGRPFHPAIASVQTPHREYFVLRENGLQIGCEEDGVSDTWMEILRVTRDGSPRFVKK